MIVRSHSGWFLRNILEMRPRAFVDAPCGFGSVDRLGEEFASLCCDGEGAVGLAWTLVVHGEK